MVPSRTLSLMGRQLHKQKEHRAGRAVSRGTQGRHLASLQVREASLEEGHLIWGLVAE